MNILPKVLNKDFKLEQFDPQRIFLTLKKETNLNDYESNLVTHKVTRCLVQIAATITTITAPMIREITNVVMLQLGYEQARLMHTRIGLPLYDINKLFFSEIHVTDKISEHVIIEYNNVKTLIKELKNANQRNDVTVDQQLATKGS